MKNKILALLLSVLLCGCQSLPSNPVRNETDTANLTLVIPVGSSDICYETAQELARRADDFADNTLSVTIVMKEDIWQALENGEADLVVCENSRLVADAEKNGDLKRPGVSSETENQAAQVRLTGKAAMMAMLEYPYFFRDSDCVLSGANDGDVLAALNYSLSETFPMELKRLSYSGQYHWLIDDYEAWENYFMENHVEDVLTEQISLGHDIFAPWTEVGEGMILQEADLTDEELNLSEKTVLLSGGRQKLLDIFVNSEMMEQLSDEHQAAVEEAIVYSGGYSRTLADRRQQQAVNDLQELQIPVYKESDSEQWYKAFRELYLSGTYAVDPELVTLLSDKTERFH